MASKMPKEVKALLDTAVAQGFIWGTTKKNHIQVRTASGQIIAITGGTPGDHRALKNFRADLRRGGVVEI